MPVKKRFTAKYKLESVRLVTDGGYTVKDAAKKRGVGNSTLSKWVTSFKESGKIDLESMPSPEPAETIEVVDTTDVNVFLRKQISQLEKEKEILIKTIAILSNK